MGDFKRSFKDYKKTLSKSRKKRVKHKRSQLIILTVTAMVFAIFSISLFFIFRPSTTNNTNPNTTNPNTQNMKFKDDNTESSVTSTEQTQDFNKLSLLDFDSFKEVINYLEAKTFKTNKTDYIKEMYKFTYKHDEIIIEQAKKILKLRRQTADLIKSLERPKEEEQNAIKGVFIKKQMLVFKMLQIAYQSSKRLENSCSLQSKKLEMDKVHNLKFIHQQLILQKLLSVKESMIKHFKEVIVGNILSYKEKSEQVNEFMDTLFGGFKALKENLFETFTGVINFTINQENQKVEFLMANLEGYKTYLVLSYYFLYMNIFEVNEMLEVVGLKKEFEIEKDGGRSDVSVESLLESCKDVFREKFQNDKENDEVLDTVFQKCREDLEVVFDIK